MYAQLSHAFVVLEDDLTELNQLTFPRQAICHGRHVHDGEAYVAISLPRGIPAGTVMAMGDAFDCGSQLGRRYQHQLMMTVPTYRRRGLLEGWLRPAS